MYVYQQSTGQLTCDTVLIATGYSGAGADKNVPADQWIKDQGPIPQGLYVMDTPMDSTQHGPFAIPLLPDKNNQMDGRAGFMMHGDSIDHPGCASEGCIIMPKPARLQVWDSGDHRLLVIA